MKSQAIENQLDTVEHRWFAVYTRPKAEKIVVSQLAHKQVESYLPIQKKVRKYTRKIRLVELPLIGGYVFVKIIKSDYIKVLETEHILNFVKFSRNLIAIPEAEIDILRRIVGDETAEIEVEKTSFLEGDKVRIASGNLFGLEGKLVASKGKNKMVIELESLGYSMILTVDTTLLEKV